VTLYEAGDRLGGQFILAAMPPSKGDMTAYSAWAARQVAKLGVSIKLNTQYSAEICDEEPPFTHGWIYTEDKKTYRKLITDEDLSGNLRDSVCVYKDLKTDKEIAWQMRFPRKLWNKVAGTIGLPKLTKKLVGSF
jgi:hypothetical protein